MSLDVLEEAYSGSEKSNAICNPRPEVARVIFPGPLPCGAEGLAWVTSSEDVHTVAKGSPREGLKIRPDRCWVHESRFHFRNQVRDGKPFDLAKSDRSQISNNSVESKFNASVSSAQADVCSCFGMIHVIFDSCMVWSAESTVKREVSYWSIFEISAIRWFLGWNIMGTLNTPPYRFFWTSRNTLNGWPL